MDEMIFELLPGVTALEFKQVKFAGDVTADFLGFIKLGEYSYFVY